MGDEESDYETSEEEETESESEEEQKEEEDEQPKKRDPEPVKIQPAPTKPPPSIQERRVDKPSLQTERPRDNASHKMTHARKQNLKSLMLNKARQDLKIEAEVKAEEKKNVLNSRIEPLADVGSMSEQDLKDLCRELHSKIDKVDEQRYDVEQKVKKNDQEIEDLNQRIFDLRGKFKRPPLRRVRMSADQMLRALLGSKHKVSMDLRSSLKSVKKEETKKDDAEVKDWRENVEAKAGMGGMKAVFEGGQ